MTLMHRLGMVGNSAQCMNTPTAETMLSPVRGNTRDGFGGLEKRAELEADSTGVGSAG